MLPSELRDDTSCDNSCLLGRQLANSVAAIPSLSRALVSHDLPEEAKLLESGDHGGRRRRIDKVDTQQGSMTIDFCLNNTGLLFQARQHGRES